MKKTTGYEKLGQSEIARFKIPYLVLVEGECELHTYDPVEALARATDRSKAMPAKSVAMVRVGDAETLRWFCAGRAVAEPGEMLRASA